MRKTGARLVLKALKKNGSDTIFGYPGGAALHFYDHIHQQNSEENSIKHILCCHEQACLHAAQGYARATGKVGVVSLTSGPGATNSVTGLTDARSDSTPILAITSQVSSHLIGTDAFQEADVVGITRPITKYNLIIKKPEDIYDKVYESIHIAKNGRQGPCLIDIPKDLQVAEIDFEEKPFKIRPSYQIKSDICQSDIDAAVKMMRNAKRPVFYCGGGMTSVGEKSCEDLARLIKITRFPITNTLMGIGVYPADDELSLKMLGMHGTYEANLAMHEADLIIAIGARFDDRVTGKLSLFSPNSKKIHVDIDPSEINKNISVDLGIVGDCGVFVKKILNEFEKDNTTEDISDWWKKIEEFRSKDSFGYTQDADGPILPQFILDRLHELTKNDDCYFTTDVGQHQMWAAQYIRPKKPRRFITSGGLGTMGFGLPAAIGAKFARPQNEVVCITGEGSFMMNLQELGTIKRYKLPVKILILNNNYLGMVRQWQDMFYEGRHTEVDLEGLMPDFVKLADSFNIKCKVIEKPSDVDSGLREMLTSKEPYILVAKVAKAENVFPMMAPNAPHSEIILK